MRWYRRHGRHHLPWRRRITPYGVLVSEIMLQQTQVDRVIPYWMTWMKRWPTIEALARAKRASVIRAWAGLGYNRRAVYLHALAQEAVATPAVQKLFALSHESAKGILEWTRKLQRLPGVGPYTANALFAFAWNLPAPCVDTNVRRVLAYAIYRRPAIMRMPLAAVMRLAARVIPNGRGRDWNYALMDYGALVLTARNVPKWPNSEFGHFRKVGKFEGSSRFWRGRIVAVLRSSRHALTSSDLRSRLTVFGAPPNDLRALTAALIRDGVVTTVGERYRLPTT